MITRRVPWWAVLALGLACVVVGVWLLADPLRSVSVLRWLIVAGLVLSGVAELASADSTPRPWLSRLVGLGWIVVGVVVASWPGVTVFTLAIAVGVALVVGGIVKVVVAVFGDGDERVILAVSGLTNVIVGVLALTWPTVTVLVLAVVFGVRTVVFGIGQIALSLKRRHAPAGSVPADDDAPEPGRWPRWVRLTGGAAGLALALGGMAVSVAIHRAQPGEPPAFYTAPSPLPEEPSGTIIRTEVMDDFYPGATAYRVLYTSTGYDHEPTAVSGIIVVPDGPAPAEGRKVIAWTHGTVGVASKCSPSLIPDYGPALAGIEEFIDAGYVIAATDYQGLGTPGPHPYLVGESAGIGALDSVRAAINLDEADASADFVVWGESQGGQASLFTGQLASSYAPELNLAGVVASAPAADLVDLFQTTLSEPNMVGNLLISMALASWARVYDEADLDQIVTPAARPLINTIAENCILSPAQILASAPAANALNVTFLSAPPWETEPWATIGAENTPGGVVTDAPILITQGEADPIVAPEVQQRFVNKLCDAGNTVDYRTYPGFGHVTIARDTTPDVVEWIADRFAGEPATNTCEQSA